MAHIDPKTGEVTGFNAPPASAMARGEEDSAVLLLVSRNERLQARQDSLLDQVESLRKENSRLRSLYDEAKARFHKSLAEAQAEFKVLERDNKVSFPTKKGGSFDAETASMNAASEAVGNSLTNRGIAVRQPVIDHPADRSLAVIRTILSFEGYEEHHDISIPSAISRGHSGGDLKEFGADLSLIRKYALFSALGLVQKVKEPSGNRGATSGSRYGGGQTGGYRDRAGQLGQQQSQPRQSNPAHQDSHDRHAGQGRQSQPGGQLTQGETIASTSAASSAHAVASGGQPSTADALPPSLMQANTMGELAAAMNSLPREERGRYTGYFQQRRAELAQAA